MCAFFQRLNKKQQQEYVALQAMILGPDCVEYLANVLGCPKHLIMNSVRQLEQKRLKSVAAASGARMIN